MTGPAPAGSRAFWDRRYETAWRMGAWAEMAEVQPDLADGVAGLPFNQTICVCLKVGPCCCLTYTMALPCARQPSCACKPNITESSLVVPQGLQHRGMLALLCFPVKLVPEVHHSHIQQVWVQQKSPEPLMMLYCQDTRLRCPVLGWPYPQA